jgi:ABC-2 type transport system permease protein
MKTLKRYLRLYAIFFRNCIVREMEFRANFVANSITAVAWLVYYLFFIEIVYSHTNAVAGWGKGHALILAGSFSISWGLMNALFSPNLSMLPEHIQKGTFDFTLTKPVDSQFLATTRTINLAEFSRAIMSVFVVIYGVHISRIDVTLASLFVYLTLLACSLLILLGIDSLIMTLSFWLVRIRNLDATFWSISIMARYPVDIFKGTILGKALTFFIPLAFIATVPARGLIKNLEIWMLPMALGFAIGLMMASRILWKRAIRSYSSAGG